MKKIVAVFSIIATMALVSCKNDTPPPAPEPEVIVAPAPQTPPPPPPAPEGEKDGTTVSVGSDGVEVSTKNGDSKTVIDVKDGKGKVVIEK